MVGEPCLVQALSDVSEKPFSAIWSLKRRCVGFKHCNDAIDINYIQGQLQLIDTFNKEGCHRFFILLFWMWFFKSAQ